MSQIGKQIVDFKVEAFVNNDFKTVIKEDVLGKWSIFFFYPADFTFVCPTELEDLANMYDEFKKVGAEIYSYLLILISCIKHGTTLRIPLRKLSTLCWPILLVF